jgi:hypothetical protein
VWKAYIDGQITDLVVSRRLTRELTHTPEPLALLPAAKLPRHQCGAARGVPFPTNLYVPQRLKGIVKAP